MVSIPPSWSFDRFDTEELLRALSGGWLGRPPQARVLIFLLPFRTRSWFSIVLIGSFAQDFELHVQHPPALLWHLRLELEIPSSLSIDTSSISKNGNAGRAFHPDSFLYKYNIVSLSSPQFCIRKTSPTCNSFAPHGQTICCQTDCFPSAS